MTLRKNKQGVTLIELLIVIAIIAILSGAIFVAVDPARRLNESRNARRWSDITALLDAIVKYQVDNDGVHYSQIASIPTGKYVVVGSQKGDDGLCSGKNSAVEVCSATSSGTGAADCIDLSGLGTGYLGSVPKDPKGGTTANTGYYISKDANNAITIGSCKEESEGSGGAGTPPVIELTR